MVKTKIVKAGTTIERGQWCIERPGGDYFPQADLSGTGGIARRPYRAAEWPPKPILAGEEFELVYDGGGMAVIGTRPLWIEIRDGKFRIDLASGTDQGELRAAIFQATQEERK